HAIICVFAQREGKRQPSSICKRDQQECKYTGVPQCKSQPDGEPHALHGMSIGSSSMYPAPRRVCNIGGQGVRSILPRTRLIYTSTALVNGSWLSSQTCATMSARVTMRPA